MSSRLATIVAGIAMAFPSITSLSHHGSNVVYDLTKSITVAGTVTEFQFVNPHTQILFDVTGDDGGVVGWLAGLPGSIRLTQEEGWSSDTLKPGDEISILGAPARNDAPSVWVEQVFLNGEPLLGDKYTG
ncbi:MAG: DUF6152 family protein [Rhodospirillaceae bacterium]|nr:DUF6152 family protein [Rhodospirillaceae bacterium]MDE0363684.1 DUF6152 family protein [Rhodospirillaceae bacterium]